MGGRRLVMWTAMLAVAVAAGFVVLDRLSGGSSLGTVVLEQGVAADRARLGRVELGPGDTVDRLGVSFGPDTPPGDLPALAEGERRLGFVTTGCSFVRPDLVVRDGALAVDWNEDPNVGCAPRVVAIVVFDVDAADVPVGVDTSSGVFGDLVSWRPLDGVDHAVAGPVRLPGRGRYELRRFVLSGCQEDDPPYLGVVHGGLVAAFPDLDVGPVCDAPTYYGATFAVERSVLHLALAPLLPQL